MKANTASSLFHGYTRRYENGARVIRWACVLLVLISFPFASSSGPTVIALLLFAAAYNSLRYVPRVKRLPLVSSRINELAIDHFIIMCLVAVTGGIASPYYPFLLILIMAMIASFGIAGFAAGLVVQGLFLLAVYRTGYAVLPADPSSQLILRLSFLIIFSLIAEQSISGRDEEHLLETNATRRLTRDRERLLTLVNSLADPVIAVDGRGIVTLYNGATLALLNTNRNLTDLALDDVLPLSTTNGKRIAFARLIRGREAVVRNDLVTGSAETGRINLELTLSPVAPSHLKYQHKKEDGYILVLRDITRQHSLDEERDEFISVASHELRTPVAIVEANLSTLLLPGFTKLDPKARGILSQAHEGIVALSELVQDLTVLSRAERGDLPSEYVLTDLGTLMSELAADYRPGAEAKKLKLTFIPPKTVISSVTAEHEVREILQNFITNAIKYTETGQIELSLERVTSGEVILQVSDTGIGIGATDKPHLFDKFYRSEDFRTRKTSGTGLGLYIARKLAARIGATIQLTSRLNHGSTFSLTIPPRGLDH